MGLTRGVEAPYRLRGGAEIAGGLLDGEPARDGRLGVEGELGGKLLAERVENRPGEVRADEFLGHRRPDSRDVRRVDEDSVLRVLAAPHCLRRRASHVEGRRRVHALGGRTLVVCVTRSRFGWPRILRRTCVRSRALFLAGIPIRDDLILELARLVDGDALADRLEDCYRRQVKLMALDIPERETIIRALDNPPPGLEELRSVLL
jgi:hypothetical protein